MKITYQERLGEDGEPLAVTVLSAGASLPQIETLVTEEGAAGEVALEDFHGG